MNKAQLVEEIQKTLGKETSKAEAERCLNAVLESIIKGIKKNEIVQLVGFGTYKVIKRKARMGVNPQTQEKMKIKASKSVKFTPGIKLRKAA